MFTLKLRGKYRNGTVHHNELSSDDNVGNDDESKLHGANYSPNKTYIHHHPPAISCSISRSKRNILVIFSFVSSFLIIQQYLLSGGKNDVRKLSRTSSITSKGGRGRGIFDLKLLGYPSKPKQLSYYYDNGSFVYTGTINYSPNELKLKVKRKIKMSKTAIQMQKTLRNDDAYEDRRRDPFEEGDCVKQHEWQTTSFPNCNKLHEVEMVKSKLIANGHWRDVWRIKDYDKSHYVLKTIRWQHDYTSRNIERHRRDAVAMERLTSSKYVLDIYGYCGQSSIVMYSSKGDLDDLIWNSKGTEVTTETLVKVAIQVARGIGDVNYIVNLNVPAISHTDVSTSQFIYIDGIYRINDFNRCRFIRWDKKHDHACGYYVGNNPGKLRSPEEYYYKEQSEKVDVYSMGNIFYVLLTKEEPFDDMKDKAAQHEVKHGRPPPISTSLRNSTDPYTQALIKAIEMSWAYDPKERSSAREVGSFLSRSLQSISKTNVKSFI